MKQFNSVESAQAALVAGLINGFSVGERVFAKKDTYIVRDDGEIAKRIDRGTHLLARTFSKTNYGFALEGKQWTGSKKAFGTFPNGKVVLNTF